MWAERTDNGARGLRGIVSLCGGGRVRAPPWVGVTRVTAAKEHREIPLAGEAGGCLASVRNDGYTVIMWS